MSVDKRGYFALSLGHHNLSCEAALSLYEDV
jgi:hypothetical protein